jgi:endonuclease/exonuclease/phosphatase family metal-dependent hydrolase
VLHWNLAGAVKNSGDYDVVDRLVAEVLAKRPDIVTMNEICLNQFDNLRGKLVQAGYRLDGNFYTAKLANCGNAGDIRFAAGAAVLVRGEVGLSEKYAFDSDNVLGKDTPIPDSNDRIVGCLRVRITGTTKDTKVCTTHLAQEDDTQSPPWRVPEIQSRELARVFGPEARSMPFVLTGDFNVPTPPANAGLSTLYSGAIGTGEFREAWEERACVSLPTCGPEQGGPPTQHNGEKGDRKLDYILADRWSFLVPVGRASTNTDVGLCDQDGQQKPCSDHFLSYAEFLMPR